MFTITTIKTINFNPIKNNYNTLCGVGVNQ